jgi:hypothetical protein
MQGMIDFLSFKVFISPYVLIICYFIGAFIIPIASFFLVKWLQSKYRPILDATSFTKNVLPELKIKQFFSLKQRILFISIIIALFISLEIMWRMLFEFLIAYLQIREALIAITPIITTTL